MVQPRARGSPRPGELPGAPAPRPAPSPSTSTIRSTRRSPGIWELREAVAGLYNRLYRQGLPSPVQRRERLPSPAAAAPRSPAPRPASGSVNLGHFLPDYTAYEELLDVFKAFTAIPILLEGERGYAFTAEDLRREIQGRGLSALLFSNPCNPTGKLVQGEELARWVGVGARAGVPLLIDEFYSHYIWTGRPGALPVESAARYVEDVDQRPGRALRRPHQELALPGLARDLDGGAAPGDRRGVERGLASSTAAASQPLQRAAIPLLDEDTVVRARRAAIHQAFREKRDRCCSRLERLGVRIDRAPDGTFYVWGNVGRPARAAQRRHGLLPRRARAEGHHRARRVLRREPRQAPRAARLALPHLRALLLRARAGDAGEGLRPARGDDRGARRAVRGSGRRTASGALPPARPTAP